MLSLNVSVRLNCGLRESGPFEYSNSLPGSNALAVIKQLAATIAAVPLCNLFRIRVNGAPQQKRCSTSAWLAGQALGSSKAEDLPEKLSQAQFFSLRFLDRL